MILNHSERAYRKTAVRPLAAVSTATQKIKVLLDFFQKIAESRGSASGRPSQRAKYPLAAASETPAPRTARTPTASQSAIRRWRNPRPKAMALAAAPLQGVDGGDHIPTHKRTINKERRAGPVCPAAGRGLRLRPNAPNNAAKFRAAAHAGAALHTRFVVRMKRIAQPH